jgi:hypothetical protein
VAGVEAQLAAAHGEVDGLKERVESVTADREAERQQFSDAQVEASEAHNMTARQRQHDHALALQRSEDLTRQVNVP